MNIRLLLPRVMQKDIQFIYIFETYHSKPKKWKSY